MPPKQQALRVAGVILAAGPGSRIGVGAKQLLRIENKPLLQHAINNAVNSTLDDLVLVLGHDASTIREAIEPAAARVVVNAEYLDGQSSSLKAGLAALGQASNAALILLGDQPGVTSDIIDAVVKVYREQRPLLVVPRYFGQRGNPVIFDRRLFPEILALTGDTGARAIFRAHHQEIVFVDFDSDAPPDVDTMDDYWAMTGNLN